MGKRHLYGLVALVLVVILAACQRTKPERAAIDLAESQKGPGLQFELRNPPGQDPERVEGEAFVVRQDNCASETPLEEAHREAAALGPSYELGAAEGIPDLAAHQGLIGELVLRRYQVGAQERAEGEVMLRTAGQRRSEFTLRWDETWDRNSVDIIREGRVIGSAPVRVRLAAQLVLVSAQEQPCAATPTGVAGKAHLPIVGGQSVTTTTPTAMSEAVVGALAEPTLTAIPTATETPAYTPTRAAKPTRTTRPTRTPKPSATALPSATPTMTAEPTATTDSALPKPGSEEAIAVVRDYIGYLKEGAWREAYDLLDATYQRRMSYESFVKGYETVTDIELYGLESTWVDEGRESVRAVMTIRTQFGTSDWMGTYEVVKTPGKEPYERRIGGVTLNRLPSEAEAKLYTAQRRRFGL